MNSRITVEDDETYAMKNLGDYEFHICFDSITEKTFDKLKIFYKFIEINHDIIIECPGGKYNYEMIDYFNLFNDDIEKILVKLEELETEKKYNL